MAAIFGNLKELIKKKKGVITQWILPVMAFMIIVVSLIGDASNDMRKSIGSLVESKFEDASMYYASSFFDAMHCLRATSIPVVTMLEQDRLDDLKEAVPYLASLNEVTTIMDAWVVEQNGTGINADGSEVMAEEEELLSAIGEGQKQFVLTTYGSDQQRVIAYVSPIEGGSRTLVSYYDPAVFLLDTSVFHFDSHTWYAIIDGKGEIITLNAGNAKDISREINVLENLKSGKLKDFKYTQILNRMGKKSVFNFVAEVGGTERYYVMAPARVNNWYFVLSTPNTYVKFLNNKSLKGIKNIVLYVVIAVIVFFIVIMVSGVMNRRKAGEHNKELEEKADTDLLTELNNKIASERKIKEYILNNPNGQAMLFLVDIDNFKKINDTMGHAFGDEVLRNIGMRLKAAFRSTDVVGRAGGDEFILLLKNINTDELIQKEANKVAGIFKNFQVGNYTKYTVTASIGCAVFPRDAADWESLYKAADVGVYKAKRAGKNRLAFYKEQEETNIGQDV